MGVFQKPLTGEYADIDDVVLAAEAARTATGNGDAVGLGDRGTLRLLLDVTAASGSSPTLDVTVETSYDSVTWRSLGTFAQKIAVGTERKSFVGADRYVRATWTIGAVATPSFTFSIAGEAV